MSNTYWNSNGRFQNEYQKLYTELVPNSGNCSTVEGELLRATCKLYYDYYNNGMCNNTSGPARFLAKKLEQVATPEINEYLLQIYNESNTGGYTSANLDAPLEFVCDFVIEVILNKNGNYQANSEDMYDYQEDDYYDEDDDEYEYDEDDDQN